MSYPYASVLMVESGSMCSPKVDMQVQYMCPEGGWSGHPIQGALYLDPRTGDAFAYCPVHRVAYRLKDNLKVRLANFSWKPITKEYGRLRTFTKSGGTKKINVSSLSTLDVD